MRISKLIKRLRKHGNKRLARKMAIAWKLYKEVEY